ncbi:MAG: helix-turn-helix transcriptional regulator [Ruminococcus sp.]|nr:helix-turn-helix transcriptional regulator [Ruminococcus sp.]
MTLGYKIKSRREELGMSQVELAEHSKLTQGYISRIEQNKYIPKASTLIVLALSLKMPKNDLLSFGERRAG